MQLHIYVDAVNKDIPEIQGIGFEHEGLDYYVSTAGETYQLEDAEISTNRFEFIRFVFREIITIWEN